MYTYINLVSDASRLVTYLFMQLVQKKIKCISKNSHSSKNMLLVRQVYDMKGKECIRDLALKY